MNLAKYRQATVLMILMMIALMIILMAMMIKQLDSRDCVASSGQVQASKLFSGYQYDLKVSIAEGVCIVHCISMKSFIVGAMAMILKTTILMVMMLMLRLMMMISMTTLMVMTIPIRRAQQQLEEAEARAALAENKMAAAKL